MSEGASAAASVTVTATVTGGTAYEADRTVTVQVGSAGDSAIEGTDYATVAPFTIEIAAGDLSASGAFTLDPTDDDFDEDDETLSVTGSSGSATVTGTSVTITDNDTAALILSKATLTVTEGESGTYSVKLATQPTTAVTVTIQGHEGSDVSLDTSTLAFATSDWNIPQIVAVSAGQDDDVLEDSITLAHSVSAGNYPAAQAFLAVTVNDDDRVSVPFVLSLNPRSVSEDADSVPVTFTAVLEGPVQPGATEVTVSVTGGTARAGIDFQPVDDFAIRIASGERSATAQIDFAPIDDGFEEPDETVIFTGETGDAGSVSGTLTIKDNDSAPSGTGPPSIRIWTDRLAYSIHSPVLLYRDVDPHGDDRKYTVFYYLESIDTGERTYLAPEAPLVETSQHVVDQHGLGAEVRLARKLRRVERELVWDGQVPHTGLWHFVAELRSRGSSQRLKSAYAKFAVPEQGFQVLNRPGTERVLTADMHLTRDRTYFLGDRLIVGRGTTLSIEAGTLVHAWGPAAAVTVEAGGRMVVRGRREAPVVMTCTQPVGHRFPGCWGGLTVSGRGLVDDGTSTANVDGVFRQSASNEFRYFRVEFAGGGSGERAAAFGLHGMGSGTVLDHVQVHASAGDGLAFRGGAAHCSHCVVSEARQSSVSWSGGWQGSTHNLYVQQGSRGAAGMQGISGAGNSDAAPTFNNATLVGGYNIRLLGGAPGRRTSIGPGIRLEGKARMRARNLLVIGFAGFAIDGVAASFERGDSSMTGAILYTNGTLRAGTRTQVPPRFEPYVRYLARFPKLLNIRYEANPDPRPPSGSEARRLGNATVPPFDRRFSRRSDVVGAFGKENWLEEWTFFGPERDYEVPVD